MEAGRIVAASPGVTDDDGMLINVEFSISETETIQFSVEFDDTEKYLDALAYWSCIMKGHQLGEFAAANREEFEKVIFSEEPDEEETPDVPRSKVSNPLFNIKHAGRQ